MVAIYKEDLTPVLLEASSAVGGVAHDTLYTLAGLATKTLIKWIHVTTTSTSWSMYLYTTAIGAKPFQIVSGRNGNFSIALDYPYADEDGTSNLYLKCVGTAGDVFTVRVLAMKMR